MANVTATAAVSLTLTPAPSTPGSSYNVRASGALTLTPAPNGPVWMTATAATGVFVSPRAYRVRWPSYTDAGGMTQTSYMLEAMESRFLDQDSKQANYKRVFYIHGTYDPSVCADIGPQVGDPDDVLTSMVVKRRTMKPYARGGADSDIVELTVEYMEAADDGQSQGGDASGTVAFEFASETEHIEQVDRQSIYPDPVAIPFGERLLINFDGENLDGLDIESPILEFTEEHAFDESAFNTEFRRTLRDSVASVNEFAFRDFAIGEVFLAGASAQKRNKTWYVTYRFRVRKGFTNKAFTITNSAGGTETFNVTKLGWQYLWIRMTERKYTENGVEKAKTAPSAVFVADVYPMIDFAVLGIGVQPMN